MASLGVNIDNLLVALLIEASQLLTGGSTESLFEISAQAAPASDCLLRHTKLGIGSLCLLGGLVLAIESVEGGDEASTDAVLVIESNGLFDGLVADDIAVGQIFGNNAGARLVLLIDVLSGVLVGGASRLVASNLVERGSRRDVNLCSSELGVIQQESSLRSSLFLECDRGRLSAVGCAGLGSDRDGLDLSAEVLSVAIVNGPSCGYLPEGEKVAHFLLTRLLGDALDVNCARHGECFYNV